MFAQVFLRSWFRLPFRLSVPRTLPRCWLPLAAILLAGLYLPTLHTPFDFIDDGSLVYPYRPDSVNQFYRVYLGRVAANLGHLGPFRPALWLHWAAEAELFGADAHTWRVARLLWLTLSAGLFLWLLQELNIRKSAALLATALAMWNPFRNEIWNSLTLSEGVAMPYALAALICAIRAARSRRPWTWDLAGILSLLIALGCKNTFLALVPAQLFLRLAPDGRDFRDGLRRHGGRAALLGLTLLLPAIHFAVFRLQWHSGQYQPGSPTWAQLCRMLSALRGALSFEWVGMGLLLTCIVVSRQRGLRSVWEEHRGACLAGLLLLTAGIVIYLPMNGASGRYAMPAVWGADLVIAALLSSLAACAPSTGRRTAFAALGCGLAVVALTNVARQEKFGARAGMLWDALHCVEQSAPAGASIAWVSGPKLNPEEGIHFQWHLRGRGRKDITVLLRDAANRHLDRIETPANDGEADFLITSNAAPPGPDWQPVREVQTRYWAGWRSYHCSIWQKAKPPSTP